MLNKQLDTGQCLIELDSTGISVPGHSQGEKTIHGNLWKLRKAMFFTCIAIQI